MWVYPEPGSIIKSTLWRIGLRKKTRQVRAAGGKRKKDETSVFQIYDRMNNGNAWIEKAQSREKENVLNQKSTQQTSIG